jgi:YD repeat-containing protein
MNILALLMLQKKFKYLNSNSNSSWDKVTNRKYTDALGNLRKEILDYSSDGTSKKNITTKYYYDELNRLVKVVNPEGQTSRYWYDEFGNVSHKFQVDQGYSSFKYDLIGNLRFSQNHEQAQKRSH